MASDFHLTPRPSFEESPLTRAEYIAALVHIYRGELGRSNVWRSRLDTTTNWAVITVMGLLSFAFSEDDHQHGTIIVGMFILLHFLTLEARRYRFYDVWRNRVRMIEENFYGPILTRELDSPTLNWGNLVASDLLHPRFKITTLQAFRARFVRNYWFLFFILLLAWIIKTFTGDVTIEGIRDWIIGLHLGPFPGWFAIALVACVYLWLIGIFFFVPPIAPPELSYWTSGSPMGQEHDL